MEPSAGEIRGIYEDCRGTDHDSGLRAVYRAGLAAEAAAHAETRAMLDKSRAYADSEYARAERFKRDYQAQQIKAEAKEWGDHFAPKIAAIEGRAQARARRVPPAREEVAILLHRLNACIGTCEDYLDDADAVHAGRPKPPEPDSAWLKRTVEEHTTARPVEVLDDGGARLTIHAGVLVYSLPRSSVTPRSADAIRVELLDAGFPLRRNAKPAEPSPQPGGFLDALTRRVEEVARHHDLRLDSLCKRLEDISMTLGAYGKKLDELEATKPKSK